MKRTGIIRLYQVGIKSTELLIFYTYFIPSFEVFKINNHGRVIALIASRVELAIYVASQRFIDILCIRRTLFYQKYPCGSVK